MFDLKSIKEGLAKVLNIQNAQAMGLEAVGQIEELTTQNTELSTKVAEYEKTIGNFPALKQEWEAATEKLKTEHASAIELLNKEHASKLEESNKALETEKNSVNKKVTKELSTVGIPEGAVKETISGQLTPQQVYDTFKSLKGAEATEYYKKHSATILKAMSSSI